MTRRRGWARLLAALCVTLSLCLVPARAQSDDGPKRFKEPNIAYKEFSQPAIQWIAGTLIILAVIAVGFKNPHRSHLD